MTPHDPKVEPLDPSHPDPGWFRRRVQEWETAEIINHEQAGSILEFEQERAGRADQAFRVHHLIGIVSAFGALLLGGGLLLFVASNWADIPRLAKVAIAVAAVVVVQGAGYWLRYRTAFHRTGSTFLLLGAIAYGAAIFLMGQTYNYPLDDPSLLLLWFLPVLPMAYLVRSRAITTLGILVGYGALGYRLPGWLDGPAGNRWDYWWQAFYIVVGVAVTAVGYLHRRFETVRPMGRPYQWIGLGTVLVLLYVMSFEVWYWPFGGSSGSLRTGWLDAVPFGMGAVLVVAAVATTTCIILLWDRGDFDRAALAGIAVPAVAGYLLVALLAFTPYRSSLFPFVVANVLLFAALVGLVTVGVLTRQEALVNVSLAVFGLAVISRYIEIGGGMFGTAVSMMIGGVIFIGLAWGLERVRRTLLSRFELAGAA